MTGHREYFAILLLFFFTLVTQMTFAKTITIPADANSIQEAVEMAASGDEIILDATEVDWMPNRQENSQGVRIVNKDLLIRGGLPGIRTQIMTGEVQRFEDYTEESVMFWAENSQVVLRQLSLKKPVRSRLGNGPTGAPFHVESGRLRVEDCDLVCALESKGSLTLQKSVLQGYSWSTGYDDADYTLFTPALQIGPASCIAVHIQDSTVTAMSDISFFNVVIREVQDSTFLLTDSQFLGGSGHNNPWEVIPGGGLLHGSDGFRIQDCTGLSFAIQNCVFQGGNGLDPTMDSRDCHSYSGAGGSGLAIVNSWLRFSFRGEPSRAKGGSGGKAVLRPKLSSSDGLFEIPASPGGHGVSVVHSRIQTLNLPFREAFSSTGAPGGEAARYESQSLPPGLEGIPIYSDESSSFEEATVIGNWSSFE